MIGIVPWGKEGIILLFLKRIKFKLIMKCHNNYGFLLKTIVEELQHIISYDSKGQSAGWGEKIQITSATRYPCLRFLVNYCL